VSGSQANRATAGDRSQPPAQFKSQSKNFLILRTDSLLAGKQSPFLGEAACHFDVQRYWPVEIIPGSSRSAGSGIGLKLFGFIAESGSPSSRNPVRVHPGTPLGIIPELRSLWTGFLTIHLRRLHRVSASNEDFIHNVPPGLR
jgi:hypothetical protein